MAVREALAAGVPLPRLRARQGLGAEPGPAAGRVRAVPPAGLVEVDETSLSFRAKDEPAAAKPGRAHEGKLLIAGAVEIVGKGPGRARLAVIGDYSAATLGGFVRGAIAAGSTVVSDGWSGYSLRLQPA